MPTTTFDLVINSTRGWVSNQIGHRSKYQSVVHPGTENLIQGWKWGEFTFPDYAELSEYSYIPVLFDSNIDVDASYYQSGFVSESDIKLNDLRLVEESDLNKWVPVVNSGSYYIQNKEWYLFSDQYVSERINSTGLKTHEFERKDGTPVFLRNYTRDKTLSNTSVNKEVKKNTTLDASAGTDEFIVVENEKKISIGTLTGMGALTEEFSGTFVNGNKVKLSVFPINSIATFLHKEESNADWAVEDSDLGIVKYTGSVSTDSVKVTYTPELFLEYEPSFAKDEVTALTADTNPLQSGTSKGFVQITTEILDPVEIELETDLTNTDTSDPYVFKYELDLGGNTVKLNATVKDKNGNALEGVKVYFDWEGQESYGSLSTGDPAFITDGDGSAYVFYASPTTIDSLGVGAFGQAITEAGGNSTILIQGLSLSNSNLDDIYTYIILHDDPVFGIATSDLSAHYNAYFAEEEIEGITADQDYEEKYRLAINSDLHAPTSLPLSLASTSVSGKKTLVVESSSNNKYIDPNTGLRVTTNSQINVPLRPSSINSGPGSADNIVYNDVNLTSGDYDGYFIVAPREVKVKAHAFDNQGIAISSNEIIIKIVLPDSINGVYFADNLSAIPASLSGAGTATTPGLLRGESPFPDGYGSQTITLANHEVELDPIKYLAQTTPILETTIPDLQAIVTSDSSAVEIPLGFRIKSDNITVAGLLNQVTFITKNS